MSPGPRARLRWALLWAAVMAVLLLAPPALVPGLAESSSHGLDKVGHVFLFLVLALLALGPARARQRHPRLWVVGACVVYGALIELLQGLSGVRNAEVLDLVADGIGSVVGVLAPALWQRL